MNLEETARVLAWCAAFDRRTIGEADVRAWHETISDLPVTEALAGVTRWYRDRTEWLMPAHLRVMVREVRADRAREARWRAAEEKGLPPAQEALGRPLASLPAETQEAVRSAARGLQGGQEEPPLDDIDRHALANEVTRERFGGMATLRAERAR